MAELTKDELLTIVGGGITASMISAVVRGVNSILELGRSVGSAIRRIQEGKVCNI